MNLVAITGIDSGIGKSLCDILATRGFTVAASYLESNPFAENPHVHGCKMDIRRENEIVEFAEFVNRLCTEGHTLYGIVNNAGVALGGPIEDTPLSVYRDVFETNFFGLISFTQKMLPHLIEDRGRIFIVGSMAGKIALPFLSPYASSKFALEGFCDSLRREVSQFGIPTVLFEPGGIATPIWTKAKKQDRAFVSPKYRESLSLFEKNFIDSGIAGYSADLAALQMYRIIARRHPGRRYIIDANPFVNKIITLLPASIIDAFTAKRFALGKRPR